MIHINGNTLHAFAASELFDSFFFGTPTPLALAVMFEVRATFPGPVLLIKADSLLLLVGFLAQEEGAPVIDVTVPAPTVNLRCRCCG